MKGFTLKIIDMKSLIIIAISIFSLNALAQGDREGRMNRESINAAKVAFLTERLDLTTETAQSFWPIYNEFETAKDQLNKKYGDAMKAAGIDNPWRDRENLTDDQAEKLLGLIYQKKAEELKLEKNYIDMISKVLSPKQTLTVSQFDSEFRRFLMRRYSEENRSRRKNSGNGN